jgi:hypothetical protein
VLKIVTSALLLSCFAVSPAVAGDEMFCDRVLFGSGDLHRRNKSFGSPQRSPDGGLKIIHSDIVANNVAGGLGIEESALPPLRES